MKPVSNQVFRKVYWPVRDETLLQVTDQVFWQVYELVRRQVSDQVTEQVYSQVYKQVYKQVFWQEAFEKYEAAPYAQSVFVSLRNSNETSE